jgi:hypothetical protein
MIYTLSLLYSLLDIEATVVFVYVEIGFVALDLSHHSSDSSLH